jgi:hypothetical protein
MQNLCFYLVLELAGCHGGKHAVKSTGRDINGALELSNLFGFLNQSKLGKNGVGTA